MERKGLLGKCGSFLFSSANVFLLLRYFCGVLPNTFIYMGRCVRIKRTVMCVLLAAIMVSVLFVIYPPRGSAGAGEVSPYEGVLRVWQIDGIEGGQGSRASFLSRAAASFEKKNDGLFVLVTAHTQESAENAVREGDLPDVLSFSGPCGFAADLAKPLRDLIWEAAQVGENTLAYPWCRGAYFLFSADGDFSGVTEENTVLSVAENANVYAAAYYEGMRGDFTAEPAEKAYVSFMNGKYKYMLGTQRDVWRFRTRNFPIYAQALQGFSDLWQYVSVCTDDRAMRTAAEEFFSFLLSDEVQTSLGKIGMLSVSAGIYGAENPALNSAEDVFPDKKTRVWLSDEAFSRFCAEAESAVKGDKSGAKNLQNYLV